MPGIRKICVPENAVKVALAEFPWIGITIGMKVAVSLPDRVFAEGEALARRLAVSRSKLYARALEEFALRHSPDSLTAAMDDALEAAGDDDSTFAKEAARRTLGSSEW